MMSCFRNAVRGSDWGYQIFVLSLISFPHLTSQFFVLDQAWFDSKGEQARFWWTIFFNGFCLMIYWNYYLACSTDPGSPSAVPSSPLSAPLTAVTITNKDPMVGATQSDTAPRTTTTLPTTGTRLHGATAAAAAPSVQHRIGGASKESEALLVHHHTDVTSPSKSPRFCHKCNGHKPVRAHHCSVCKRCVLKMDHHCPWINNCVGFRNQGHFFRFLLFVDMTCSSLLVVLCVRLVDFMEELSNGMMAHRSVNVSPWFAVFLGLDVVLVFFVVVSVGILSIYQIIYVFTNTTTIESWERDKVDRMVKREKLRKIQYPFDLGYYRNLCAVLGDRAWLWLVPQPMQGDGLTFAVAKGCDDEEEQEWPPKEYYTFHYHSPYDDDDESDYELEPVTGGGDGGSGNGNGGEEPQQRARIRRGSEGWEVRPISYEDREAMVEAALAQQAAWSPPAAPPSGAPPFVAYHEQPPTSADASPPLSSSSPGSFLETEELHAHHPHHQPHQPHHNRHDHHPRTAVIQMTDHRPDKKHE